MYARYTEYLRDIMLNEHSKPLLDKALSTYPLYASQNPNIKDLIPTREKLNEKLLNHYKYREIGFETVGRFLDELEITMCEIMPRYNELFKTVEIMAELPSPFDNVDVVETFEQETSQTASSSGSTTQSGTSTQNGTTSQSGEDSQTGTSSQTGTTSQSDTTQTESNDSLTATIGNTSNAKQIVSDTPQDDISVGTKNISGVTYGSQAQWNENISSGTESKESSLETQTTLTGNGTSENETETRSTGSHSSEMTSESSSSSSSEGSSSGESQSSGTVKHTFTKKGNQGVNTYAHDMNEFRTSIIDVVGQIINDSRIGELFMLVY